MDTTGSAGTPPPSDDHGTGGQAGPPPPAPGPVALSSDDRGWAIGAHLGGLGMGMITAATLGFLAPLLVWLSQRDQHPYVEHHAKEALNFQLTVLLVAVAGAILTIPAVIIGVLTLGIGLVILGFVALAALVLWIVLPIMAAVAASRGEGYRYPLTIRFVR